MSLCWRCEWRVGFHETGNQPRHECGQIERSIDSCYMFMPVKPIPVKKSYPDDRPISLSALGARVSFDKDVKYKLALKGTKTVSGMVPHWVVKEDD